MVLIVIVQISHLQCSESLSISRFYYQSEAPVVIIFQIGIGYGNNRKVFYTIGRFHHMPNGFSTIIWVNIVVQSLKQYVSVTRTQDSNQRNMIHVGLLRCLPSQGGCCLPVRWHSDCGCGTSVCKCHRDIRFVHFQRQRHVLVVRDAQLECRALSAGERACLVVDGSARGLAVQGLRVGDVALVITRL